ncbi:MULTISPECIES: hypothetical protein [unclassified Caballeronia]|uniref:hypothetical protein n=1 Tax=unclassified Caballeronia TaxID=2646786 RepID=UPI0020299C21|nr:MULTISPECIES: hypothetical protein [unclassified Caballeronia]
MNAVTPSLWLTAAGLGAFHGVNPAMGWLFALALGLYAHSRRVVLVSLVPIALGHAASVALVLAGVLTLGSVVDHETLARGSGVCLIGWGAWRAWRGHRGRPTVGMRTGLAGLALWSFVMSSAHGAGLMLVPALLPLCGGAGANAGAAGASSAAAFEAGALALSVHTVAMLAVIAVIALAAMSLHERTGLAFLRTGWVNVDWLWSVALIACGIWLWV